VTEQGACDEAGVGFAAIGSGGPKALWALARWSTSLAGDLNRAVYAVFEAKKYAECTPGINDKTDLLILRGGAKPLWLGAEELTPLKEVYQAMRPPLSEGSLKRIREMLDAKLQATGPS
jgi:hypothetical protein